MTEDREHPKPPAQETGLPVPEQGERERTPAEQEAIALKQEELRGARELSRADTVGSLGNAEANIRILQAKAELSKKGGDIPHNVFGTMDRSLRKFAHVIGTAAVLSAGFGIEQALHHGDSANAATLQEQSASGVTKDVQSTEMEAQKTREIERHRVGDSREKQREKFKIVLEDSDGVTRALDAQGLILKGNRLETASANINFDEEINGVFTKNVILRVVDTKTIELVTENSDGTEDHVLLQEGDIKSARTTRSN